MFEPRYWNHSRGPAAETPCEARPCPTLNYFVSRFASVRLPSMPPCNPLHNRPQHKAEAGSGGGTCQDDHERDGADHHGKEQDGTPAIGGLLQIFAQHLNEAVHHEDKTKRDREEDGNAKQQLVSP